MHRKIVNQLYLEKSNMATDGLAEEQYPLDEVIKF